MISKNLIMYASFILVFFHLFGGQTSKMCGTYEDRYSKSKDAPFKLIEIHYSSPSTILFYVEVGRGAPDYNGGSIYGKLILNIKTGNYEYLPTYGEDCKLILDKKKNTILIKKAKGDCGFGYGVDVNGVYKLTDVANPQFFIDRHGKKIYFDKISPEKYLR